MEQFKLGDTAIWHTGYIPGDKPETDPKWLPKDKRVTIIKKMVGGKVLVELEDGSRVWTKEKFLDVKGPKGEK